MAFTNNPSGSAIDRVRLFCGDIDPNVVYLDDTTYSYLLTKHSDNEKKAAREAMQYILFSLARRTRERAHLIEVYGDQMFANYERALKLALSNPELYSVEFLPYAGGISREDMTAHANNTDNVDSGVFRGMNSYSGSPSYLTKTIYTDADGNAL